MAHLAALTLGDDPVRIGHHHSSAFALNTQLVFVAAEVGEGVQALGAHLFCGTERELQEKAIEKTAADKIVDKDVSRNDSNCSVPKFLFTNEFSCLRIAALKGGQRVAVYQRGKTPWFDTNRGESPVDPNALVAQSEGERHSCVQSGDGNGERSTCPGPLPFHKEVRAAHRSS